MKDASVTDLQLSQLVLLIVSLDDSDHLILTPILALACRAILSPQIYNLHCFICFKNLQDDFDFFIS